ncbi:hypothetical protein [Lyngbya sp. PCC 8106]|uniref:hypothetical protein n=1 Tax=Lyngbya sp. (strain PCC 8106) TaxID=313612 RepID=UPI0000EAC109|nr:hypothetical protein [Lyngbya sp. PCC 8106]EAW35582.1 hypothetical protein L8106_13265 [Lyngbya sp. PCC 8106]
MKLRDIPQFYHSFKCRRSHFSTPPQNNCDHAIFGGNPLATGFLSISQKLPNF